MRDEDLPPQTKTHLGVGEHMSWQFAPACRPGDSYRADRLPPANAHPMTSGTTMIRPNGCWCSKGQFDLSLRIGC